MILNSIVKMVRGLIGLDNLSGPITHCQSRRTKRGNGLANFYLIYGTDECKFRDIKFIAYSYA